jgi:hypothetical protein
MINLENKVVLVRANGDYPENSPKKWIVLVGEIVLDEELKVEKMVEGEAYAVDFLNAVCSMSTWSGIVPSGAFKHNLLLMAEHFYVAEDEQGQSIAIVGTLKQEEVSEEPMQEGVTQEPTPVNPELELDAE